MPKSAEAPKCAHVFYSGRVHGVGFRLTVEETAHEFGVVGWVRNLRDGRVELIAQAGEAALEGFLEALRVGPMSKFIQHVEISWSAPNESFDEFEIRY